MRKPNSVTILGQLIDVEYVDDLIITEGIYGDACAVEYKIRLDASLDDEKFKHILRHEKMHIILRLSGLVEHLSPETEEALCCLMEHATL